MGTSGRPYVPYLKKTHLFIYDHCAVKRTAPAVGSTRAKMCENMDNLGVKPARQTKREIKALKFLIMLILI